MQPQSITLITRRLGCFLFFFFNDTATTEIYTLSLHDALPILPRQLRGHVRSALLPRSLEEGRGLARLCRTARSEEHTSELQSPDHLVCRLLLEKKKTTRMIKRCAPFRRAL